MNSSLILLDKYVKACSHESDSAAARALSLRPSAVNNWRRGVSHPNAESIARMCEATGENPAKWLPLIEAERCRSAGDRKAWMRIAQAAACLLLTFGLLNVQNANASDTAQLRVIRKSVYYVNLWKCLRRLGMILAGFLQQRRSGYAFQMEV